MFLPLLAIPARTNKSPIDPLTIAGIHGTPVFGSLGGLAGGLLGGFDGGFDGGLSGGGVALFVTVLISPSGVIVTVYPLGTFFSVTLYVFLESSSFHSCFQPLFLSSVTVSITCPSHTSSISMLSGLVTPSTPSSSQILITPNLDYFNACCSWNRNIIIFIFRREYAFILPLSINI